MLVTTVSILIACVLLIFCAGAKWTRSRFASGNLTSTPMIGDVEPANILTEAQTKNAAEAVSLGIIDEVREFSIPTGSPVVQLVFQR